MEAPIGTYRERIVFLFYSCDNDFLGVRVPVGSRGSARLGPTGGDIGTLSRVSAGQKTTFREADFTGLEIGEAPLRSLL